MAHADRLTDPLLRSLDDPLVLAAQRGDGAARARLVDNCLPLIAGAARAYRASGRVQRNELMQEGVVGVLRALDRYDPRLGTPFWGYASWWVRRAMQRLVAELGRPVVLSDRALRHLGQLRDASRQFRQAEGRSPSTGELAARAGLPVGQVERLLSVDRAPRGLDEPLGDAAGGSSLGDRLCDPCGEDAYEWVDRRVTVEQVRGLRDKLGEREQVILDARHRANAPPETLREIARRLGLSAERVRQLEERALAELAEAATPTGGRAAGVAG